MTHISQSSLIIVLLGLQLTTLTVLVLVFGRMVLHRQAARDYKELLDEAEELWGSSLASRKEQLALEKQLLLTEKNT